VYPVEAGNHELVNAAVKSAQAVFLEWSNMAGMERSRILRIAVALLHALNDMLAQREVIDTGKPWQEASVVDVGTGADVIGLFAGLAPLIEGSQQSLGDDFYYTRSEPLGVCAGVGAWNYPLE
jgi:betaine-aldehyde dehydrogenase